MTLHVCENILEQTKVNDQIPSNVICGSSVSLNPGRRGVESRDHDAYVEGKRRCSIVRSVSDTPFKGG